MIETFPTTLEADKASALPGYHVELSDNPSVSSPERSIEEEFQAFAKEFHEVAHPIISPNAGVIVRCDRFGGAEMTLSEAVYAIWTSDKEAMVRRGLPSLMAEIHRMLNNRKEEPKEEQKEQDQATEDRPDETEEGVSADDESAKTEGVAQKNNSKTIAQKEPVPMKFEKK